MRGKASLLSALLLVLLCVAARLQGAWGRGGHGEDGGGGGGGRGEGEGGGGQGGGEGEGEGEGGTNGRDGGGSGTGDDDDGWRGGTGYGFVPWSNERSAAAEPRGRGVWRVSGASAALAAAALVWWPWL